MSDGVEFKMRFHGVPVYVSERAPLRKTKHPHWDEYESVEIECDALCVLMDGAIHIHPHRMAELEAAGIDVRRAVSG